MKTAEQTDSAFVARETSMTRNGQTFIYRACYSNGRCEHRHRTFLKALMCANKMLNDNLDGLDWKTLYRFNKGAKDEKSN